MLRKGWQAARNCRGSSESCTATLHREGLGANGQHYTHGNGRGNRFLRAVEADRKVALLKRWFDEGKRTVIFWQMAKPGEDLAKSPGVQQTTLLEVNSDWIVVDVLGARRSFPYSEFNVGYDPQQGLPQIRYHGGC